VKHPNLSDRRLLAAVAIIFVVAALPRLLFVREVIADWKRLEPELRQSDSIAFLDPDSGSYMRLAKRILDANPLGAVSLRRPPGYPFFLALLGAQPERVLWAQALLGAFIAPCVLILAYVITRSVFLGLAAGLLSALSPTGIGVAALIMSDLLLAALFALGLLALLLAARAHGSWLLVVAGYKAHSVVLVSSSPAGFLAILREWASSRSACRNRPLFRPSASPPPLLWSAANYVVHGAFSYSDAGALTARTYWGARAEAWIEAGEPPSAGQIRKKVQQAWQRAGSSKLSETEKIRQYREETRNLIREHPSEMARAFFVNADEQTRRGWNLFKRQLPLKPEVAQRLAPLVRLEGKAREYVRWLLVLLILGLPLLWALGTSARSSADLMGVLALTVAWLYFVVASGITFWTGPRILYPVQLAEIVVPLAALRLAISGIRRRRPAPR
jgi:hypothetical protein